MTYVLLMDDCIMLFLATGGHFLFLSFFLLFCVKLTWLFNLQVPLIVLVKLYLHDSATVAGEKMNIFHRF